MILSDRDIKKHLEDGKITVDPLFPDCIQPASIDLHLGAEFLVFKNTSHTAIDLKKPLDDMMEPVTINAERPFVIHPGEFALGITYETIGVADDMVGRLEGKSSLGRVGLIIHATAGYLDPGNKLRMTLELHNIANLPIILYYKMPIAQLSFTPLSSKAEHPYNSSRKGSKYYGATGPQASQYYKNFIDNKWEAFK